MIRKSILATAVSAILLGGCTAGNVQDQYSYQLLDESKNEKQQNVVSYKDENTKQREQIYLLSRQLERLESQLKHINLQKQKLQQEITLAQYKSESLSGTSEQKEMIRIEQFKNAVGASQARVAEYEAKLELATAEIETGLDAEIASIESSTAQQIADLESKKQLRISKLKNTKRTELAKVRAKAKMDAAQVVAPILSDSGLHTSLDDTHETSSSSRSLVTAKTVSMHKPGFVNPTIKKSKTRNVYDVMYVFKTRNSWKHFNKFLRSYGVRDMFEIPNRTKGEFITYVVRFYRQGDAERRKKQLARMTHTDHAIIKKKTIKL